MYTNRVFGTAKFLFIEVSSFQGVLNKGFHCMSSLQDYMAVNRRTLECWLCQAIVIVY